MTNHYEPEAFTAEYEEEMSIMMHDSIMEAHIMSCDIIRNFVDNWSIEESGFDPYGKDAPEFD